MTEHDVTVTTQILHFRMHKLMILAPVVSRSKDLDLDPSVFFLDNFKIQHHTFSGKAEFYRKTQNATDGEKRAFTT